jgi:hypothetical protein
MCRDAKTKKASIERRNAMSSIIAGATLAAMLITGPIPELPIKSGPQVGAKNNRGAFFPNLVTGPGAGERRCPV